MDAPGTERPAPGILIVDDTPANLRLLCEILAKRGYEARPFPSGELALRAAAACPPELVLLDVDMPGMTGFDVCERLKADPALKDVPVIFISAMNDLAAKVKGFAVGGVDYITKPFQLEEVHARLATHLELRRQRRELQETNDRLRELEALRESLVHMLVHDLRSPLQVLTLSLELVMRDAALAPQTRGLLGRAGSSARRLVLMINAVLDVNKLEAAEVPLQLSECDVVALAQEVVASLGTLAEGQALTLRPQGGELRSALDREMVFRVVQNMVANALSFAPLKGGLVEIEVDRAEDGLRLRVTDNGSGIPAEHHRRIFEKFGNVSGAAAARWRNSTGLGLPFCKLAVEAHGGRIGVDSEAGKGATFWFVLPDCPKSAQPHPGTDL